VSYKTSGGKSPRTLNTMCVRRQPLKSLVISFSATVLVLIIACAAGPTRHSRFKKECSELDSNQILFPTYFHGPRYIATPYVDLPKQEWVDVQFAVLENGRTSDIEVTETFPTDRHKRRVIDAVSGWRFCPRSELTVAYPERSKTRLCLSVYGDCPRCNDCNLRLH